MNKTRYSATEFGGNKPMNFRLSGTLRVLVGLINQVKGLLRGMGGYKQYIKNFRISW